MNAIVPKEQYLEQLKKAVSFFKGNYSSVMLHTDLLKIGIIDRRGSKEEVFSAHFDCLQEAFEGRPLLFATFNYSFFQSRIYNVLNDPCEIGMLNEYARRRFAETRSLSPVFNFVIANNHDYDTGFHEELFGEESIFRQAIHKNALICMLGPGMEHSTFQHTVEEVAGGVPYRYKKSFKGKVIAPTESFNVTANWPVLPKAPDVAEMIKYRFDFLSDRVEEVGGLTKGPLGLGEVLIYSARAYSDRISALLHENSLNALTLESQEKVSRYLDKLGGPMTIDNMEPGWNPEPASNL